MDKPLVWLHGEVKSPPLSLNARVEAGWLLRQLQGGELLPMTQSRPMQVIGPRCHELRIQDADRTWRVIYRLDDDAVVIVDVFAKSTAVTPKSVIESCRRRLALYDSVV